MLFISVTRMVKATMCIPEWSVRLITQDPKADIPAMPCGVTAYTRRGIFARNVAKLVLENTHCRLCNAVCYEMHISYSHAM
ncbi:MAG: hypothetical protein IKB01_05820 [Lachnospiraceae bacterium]|nr:hypothetical protein [Lachnospiraceae bacterium]